MKTLVYLIGLFSVGLLIAWVGFGIHPQTVYYKTINMFNSSTNVASEQATNMKNTGSRFVDVIKNNYNDQDMTQGMKH